MTFACAAAAASVAAAWFMRRFDMCRICFHGALKGELPGVVKSSW
jgi:ribosomal protein S14